MSNCSSQQSTFWKLRQGQPISASRSPGMPWLSIRIQKLSRLTTLTKLLQFTEFKLIFQLNKLLKFRQMKIVKQDKWQLLNSDRKSGHACQGEQIILLDSVTHTYKDSLFLLDNLTSWIESPQGRSWKLLS